MAKALKKVFFPLSPSAVETAISKPSGNERAAVLNKLNEWVRALYDIRNEYSHGKVVTTFRFGDRSIWEDAFEIFRLAADRVILHSSERKPPNGSLLEKRLMSVEYYDVTTAFFSKKDQWLEAKRASSASIKEAIRKARTLDPELVETISSQKVLKQALFNICRKMHRTLRARQNKLPPTYLSALNALQEAYEASRAAKGAVDIDIYLKQASPYLNDWFPYMPIEATRIPLYELVEAFKNLLVVYRRFTH